jgi:hypothetical protein
VLTLIIAYGESALFCKNLAVKVIDALSHWLKNLLHHRARFFIYIGNSQLVGQSQSGRIEPPNAHDALPLSQSPTTYRAVLARRESFEARASAGD